MLDRIVMLMLCVGAVCLFFGILGWVADLIAWGLGWDDEEEEKGESPDRTGGPEQGGMRKSTRQG